uniref:ShKT domain-containing protein n=1 Tax=Rhabditophanes sp. KR3021 TaxID=114890 RepID=A0AC35U1Y0_9BILA
MRFIIFISFAILVTVFCEDLVLGCKNGKCFAGFQCEKEACVKCTDKADNCSDLKAACTITAYKKEMDQCKKTCGFCEDPTPSIDCKDTEKNCAELAKYCKDPKYEAMLSKVCKKTCSICT